MLLSGFGGKLHCAVLGKTGTGGMLIWLIDGRFMQNCVCVRGVVCR